MSLKSKVKKVLIGYYFWCYLISVHASGYNMGATFQPWGTFGFVASLVAAIPLGAVNMVLYPPYLMAPPEPVYLPPV